MNLAAIDRGVQRCLGPGYSLSAHMPQLPEDECVESYDDECNLTHDQLFRNWQAAEADCVRLREQIALLKLELANTIPMPPRNETIEW